MHTIRIIHHKVSKLRLKKLIIQQKCVRKNEPSHGEATVRLIYSSECMLPGSWKRGVP